MSKNKIVEYVMNTPGNTNRAILSQMVELETEGALEIAKQMDAETLVMANAYTDKKAGYSEVKKVVVFPKTTFEGALDNNGYYEFTSEGPLDFPAIDISKPCVCIFDGVRYDYNVSDKAEGDLYPEYFTIGNRKMAGYTSSGQLDGPFCLCCEYDLWLYADTAGEHTLEIYQETETIHTIDQKYLPGVCLPVVELSTVVGAEMVALNEADSSALESAIKTKMPIVMVLHENIEGAEALWSVHAVYVDIGGMGCYIASVTTTIYQFGNEGNGWVCYKQSMV